MPPIPEGGCHILDARDLAEAQLLAYETPTAQGRYIVAGQFFKFSEFMKTLKEINPSLKIPRFQIPVWTLHAFRPLDWLNHKITGRSRQLTGELIRDFVGKFQRVSTEKIKRDLSWSPRPAEETIKDTFAWISQIKSLKI
jgi:dihydroflavonol-4-reductase